MLIDNFSNILDEKIDNVKIVTRLKINGEHALFEGHFPENPVTPGVVMIQIFKEQAERFTEKKLQLIRASNIKFLTVIDPEKGTEVLLESTITTNNENIELTGRAFYKQAVSIKLKLIFEKLPAGGN